MALSIFDSLPPSFVDPITGTPPSNERELSALLAVFHQQRRIAWDRVKLYGQNRLFLSADRLFAINGTIGCEYPLFVKSQEQLDIWGDMRADLVYLQDDRSAVVLVESKLGSRFTSGGIHPQLGQLGRQAEYLLKCSIPKRYLILLSTAECFRTCSYSDTLFSILAYNNRSAEVQGYFMYWEEILSALR